MDKKTIVIVIIIFILLVGGSILMSVIDKIKRKIKRNIKTGIHSAIDNVVRETVGLSTHDISQLSTMLKDDEIARPKSVGGATSLYLNKITNDFPDFHKQDAETALKKFITEFLEIKYENKEVFDKSNVDESILPLIDKHKNTNISNIIFNKIAIYDYYKSDEYATIKYQCSVGFNLNGNRYETRFIVEYTLRLLEDNISVKAMTCPNCGASIENTSITQCEYCDAKIIKDTIFNWVFTSITEN